MSIEELRMTTQRRLILEELRKLKSHPTAYDVYELVKLRLPQISLGTVYRNLEILSANGVIQRLDLGKGQRRFDAITDEHNHIRCTLCGRVDDINLNTLSDIANSIHNTKEACGYKVSGYTIEFYGLCPACQGQDHKK